MITMSDNDLTKPDPSPRRLSRHERIGIYGGTFSPVHSGHIRAANCFLDCVGLDRLYMVPTALPPHKAAVDGASDADRLEMLRLAIADDRAGKLEVSDWEISRQGKSYTIYTLEHFTKPERELYMLVGTDMFLTLDKWYRAVDIFRLATITLMRRENDRSLDVVIDECRRRYAEDFGARIVVIDRAPFEVSSTELRRRISSGDSLEGLIPDPVAGYIKKNRLYTNSKSRI